MAKQKFVITDPEIESLIRADLGDGANAIIEKIKSEGYTPAIKKQLQDLIPQRLNYLTDDKFKSGLKTTEQVIADTKDITSATDTELRSRIEALNATSENSASASKTSQLDYNKIRQSLVQAMEGVPIAQYRDAKTGDLSDQPGGGKYNLGSKEEQIDRAAQIIFNMKRLPTSGEEWARELGHNNVESIGQIAGILVAPSTREFFDKQIQSGNFYTEGQTIKTDTSKDVNDATTLLEQRATQGAEEAKVQDFMNTLPAELARTREGFLNQQTQQAGEQFREVVAPDVAQMLNVKGLLNSGDLPSELNRSASALFSPIQQAEQDLMEQDDLFFQNAGYQTALRKEIQAGQDVTSSIQANRAQTTQNQNLNFQRTQADLQRAFNENQAQRASDRAYSSYQRQLQSQQDLQSRQNKTNTVSSIGGAVGSIGGAIIGSSFGPVGTVIGSNLGNQIGGGSGRGIVGG